MKLFLLSVIAINIFALNLCITVPSTYQDYAEELEMERISYYELLHNRQFEHHQADIEEYFLAVSEAFSIGNTLDEQMQLDKRDYVKEDKLRDDYSKALQALDKPRAYIQSLYYSDLSNAIDKDNEKYVKFLVMKGSVVLDSNENLKEKVLQYSTLYDDLAETSAIKYLQDEKKMSKTTRKGFVL